MAAANICMPFRPAFENSVAVPGAQAVLTLSGTTTLVSVYSNAGLSVAATNPIVANSAGRFPQRFVDDAVALRMRVFAADADITSDDPIEDFDPYTPVEAGSAAENPDITYVINTLAAGEDATLVVTGSYPTLTYTFGIPAGEDGATSGASWGAITGTLSNQTDLNTALGLKAALAGPTFTGVPAAPTAATTTSTTQLATTAFVQQEIAAAKVHSLYIPASAMTAQTTNGAAVGSLETTTNDIMRATYDFDASTIEYVQAQVALGNSWNLGTVTVQFFWEATNTGDVVWGAQGVCISNDDVIDAAFGTAQTVTDSVIATTDLHVSAATAAITLAGTPADADLTVFRFYRNASSGSDTCAVDAKLLGVKVNFTTNAADDS